MATNDLGRIQPIPQGDWDALTAYEILDIVNHNDSSWISTGDSVNSEPADGNANWQVLGRQTASAGGGTRAVQEIQFDGTVSGIGSTGQRTIQEIQFLGGPTTNYEAPTTGTNSEIFTIPVRQNFVAATVDDPPSVTMELWPVVVTNLDDRFNGTYRPYIFNYTADRIPERWPSGNYLMTYQTGNNTIVTQVPLNAQNQFGNTSSTRLITDFTNNRRAIENTGPGRGLTRIVIFVREGDMPENSVWLFGAVNNVSLQFANGTLPAFHWGFIEAGRLPPTFELLSGQSNVVSADPFDHTTANIEYVFPAVDSSGNGQVFPRFYPAPTSTFHVDRVSVTIPNIAPRRSIAIQDNESAVILPESMRDYDYVSGHTEAQDREAILNEIIDLANNGAMVNPPWTLTYSATGDSTIDTGQLRDDRYSLITNTELNPHDNGSGYALTVNGSTGGTNMADTLTIVLTNDISPIGGDSSVETDTIMQMSNQPIGTAFLEHNVTAINAVAGGFTASTVGDDTLMLISNSDGPDAFVVRYSSDNGLTTIVSTEIQEGSFTPQGGTALPEGTLVIDGDEVPILNGDSAATVAERASRAVDNPLWLGSVRGNTKATFASVDNGARSQLPITYTGEGLTFTTTFTNGT